MSLHTVAKHLATKGRGPDTLLIHMTPGEVHGLQALAQAGGGSLTVNPDTGLPEAGILSSLLPTLIGAGITAATGGAAAPWMIGAGMGGLEALRTGSLNKGLMAGLGGYGGAGLTGSLMGMGEAALAQGAGAALPQTMVDEFGQTVMNPAYTGTGAAAPTAGAWDKLKAGAGTFDWNKPMDFVSGLGGGSKGKGFGMLGAAFGPGVMAALEPQQYAQQQMVSDATRAPALVYTGGNQYRRMTSDEEAERKAKYGYAEGGLATGGVPEWNPDVPEYGNLGQDFGRERMYSVPLRSLPSLEKLAAKQAETAASGGPGGDGGPGGGQDFGGMQTSTPDWGTTLDIGQTLSGWGLPSIGDYLQSEARMGINAQTGAYSQEAQNQRAAEAAAMSANGYSPGTSGAPSRESTTAESGNVDSGGGGGGGGYGANNDGGGGYGPQANGGVVGRFASGGLGSLGGYSDGGRLLRGPGDGVSDSIPATIGRARQPARLADGEFVFPARIVSEIGNGSTEAGARKLYAMMDRIQKNRGKTVGKGRVAVDSKASRHLIA